MMSFAEDLSLFITIDWPSKVSIEGTINAADIIMSANRGLWKGLGNWPQIVMLWLLFTVLNKEKVIRKAAYLSCWERFRLA